MNDFNDFLELNHDPQCNCLDCRMGLNHNLHIEFFNAEIDIQDPIDIIEKHLEAIKEVDSEEDMRLLLDSLFLEGMKYGVKEYVLDEIEFKISQVQNIDFEFYDDGS